ncbi:hypothetical protein M378DRAFT_117693 [Amanita muscaria Koide BX008]|uniref:Reverse transcriptase n=1 Tax=Amanita muscaria (strain Koide BX008) TaxID=946122 RepID=A0A0C2XN34_AMAMK|nr:hypothetical protein M378DRAFT_117693 [Amanita muscaria Koide BX008]
MPMPDAKDPTYIRALHAGEKALENGSRKSLQDLLPDYCQGDFLSLFEKTEFDRLPDRRQWDHAIELRPGTEPFNSKIYPLNPAEQAELDKFIEEHLRTGRIRPSKSPIASPFFFVKKKDGTLRPVQDYRKLNAITVKNRYPLPLISEVVHKLRGAKYFTKLDIRWGYNNIRIREGDEWKAAFTTNRGLFEPLVMFFGLTNSPATFQTMMNDLFRDLVRQGTVIVYMDDILIFTKTLEEHRSVTRAVLTILKNNKLCLKPEKCEFERTKIEYLGIVISRGSIAMDPKKVAAIMQWPVPRTKQELQQFLGFLNFYRRFIHNFAKLAQPLYPLTGNAPWHWSAVEASAFDSLKTAVTSAPVLAIPKDDAPYRLETDSSGYATGAVLSQLQDDHSWHPIAFFSKTLSPAERNYDIYDREMLAIIRALEEWRPYLMGTSHVFEIWTDHKNLQYFSNALHLNRRQARWSQILAEYNFTLIHRPGKQHGQPDTLSRRPDYDKGQTDNANTVLLSPTLFRQVVTTTENEGDVLLEQIRNSRDIETGVIETAKKKQGMGWAMKDGLIFWRNRVYVPRNRRLRDQIIQLHHDSPEAGHPGRFKTTELILRTYWWPRLHADVAAYVRGCDKCQRTKDFPTRPMGTLAPNLVPERSWQIVSVDLISQLPTSHGYDAIVVVVDRFSKMIRLTPVNEQITSEGMARIYRDRVWRDFGLPERILSDRGPQFASHFMKDLNYQLGIKGNLSTAYHPETDGQTECINHEVEQYLRLFVNYHQNNWSEWLAIAEFSYNDKVQVSTGYSPFFLNYGQHPRKGFEPRGWTKTESVETFIKSLNNIREDANSALVKAAATMKHFYDRHRQEACDYKPGDYVWLEATHIRSARPSKKLDDRRLGPFKIVTKVGQRAYRLQLPVTWRLHPVFHTSLLHPYQSPSSPLQTLQVPNPPLPIQVGDHLEQEVEVVLDERTHQGQKEYLVKWKGLPREENTWEPRKNLEDKHGINVEFRKYLQHHEKADETLKGG